MAARSRQLSLIIALLTPACASVPVRPDGPSTDVREQDGYATFYSDSLAGHHTASGVPYDPSSFTAAHRTLPLGTVVRVERVDRPGSVEVRINDRGPYGSSRRIIDLSRAAATQLHMLSAGVVPVRLRVLEWGSARRGAHAR